MGWLEYTLNHQERSHKKSEQKLSSEKRKSVSQDERLQFRKMFFKGKLNSGHLCRMRTSHFLFLFFTCASVTTALWAPPWRLCRSMNLFLMTLSKSRPQRGSRAQSVSVVPRVPGTQVMLQLQFAKTNFDHKLHCNISQSQGLRRSQHTTEGGWRMEGPSSRASTGSVG